ncbi:MULTISPECIES: hypothetical protein [unclassified Streptomyces]|uniref:hypothetical protein n=1 Tax=unclassified Streptomyces TaxID=2593676 RepID=UPI003667DF68
MTTVTAPTAGRRAAVDLAAVREQWGDLLAAIGRRVAAPGVRRIPRPTRRRRPRRGRRRDARRGRRRQTPAHHPRAPCPLNAALAVERDLFADADAEQVQRPAVDQDDRDNLARWHLPTSHDIGAAAAASPGSRAYGLHWAAV